MALLTAEQAATRLKRTERTIRRWVTEGKLQATHPVHGRTSKVLIDEQEVERLRNEIEQEQQMLAASEQDTRDTSDELTHRIESIEILIEGFEQRLEGLEQLVQDLIAAKQAQPSIVKPARAEYKVAPVHDEQVASSLPAHLVAMTRFAQHHTKEGRKPPETTFRTDIKKGSLKAVRPDDGDHWVIGNNPVKVALGEEGRANFYKLYHNREWFQERECCPHEASS